MTVTVNTVTASPLLDDQPCPRVELVVDPIRDDAVTLTMWRVWDGGTTVVRGAIDAVAAGAWFGVDYETPLGVPVQYYCTTTDAAGTVSDQSTPTDPLTLDVTQAWLQDPLDPSSAMQVNTEDDIFDPQPAILFRVASFASVTYSQDVTVSNPPGSDLPIASASKRRRVAQMPLEVRAADVDTAAAFRELVMAASPLLARTGPNVPVLPSLAYLSVPDWAEGYVRGPEYTIFTGTGQMVKPPTTPVLIAARSLDDLGAEAATLDDLGLLYATLLDAGRGHA